MVLMESLSDNTKAGFNWKVFSIDRKSISMSCELEIKACATGYARNGSDCFDVNECENNEHSCDSNANCFNSDGSFSCTCKDGFIGDGHSCQEQVKNVISCEWPVPGGETDALLSCLSGKIQTITAHYGRWDKTTCKKPGEEERRPCSGFADHTNEIRAKCDGKAECTWHGNNGVAGDPCGGIVKYTLINYICT